MSNKYVEFISDEHFLNCVEYIFNIYEEQKKEVTEKKFYKNKVDPIRFTFDINFLEKDLGIETYLGFNEITRQINKTIQNAIGDFHEMMLGGIEGYERGNFDGYDIKAIDNTLFADTKNKHNTINYNNQEGFYQKLENIAELYPSAKVYHVQMIAKKSIHKKWVKRFDVKKENIKTRVYNHDRVYVISGDQFYKLLTGNDYAFKEVMEALPVAINDFLENNKVSDIEESTDLLKNLKNKATNNNYSLLDQIFYDTFNTYLGFDEWKR